MAKRRRAAKILRRRPRSWLGVIGVACSLAAVVLSSVETDAEGKVTDPARIFAAFADLNLGPDAVLRMRPSPRPPEQIRGRWRTIVAVADGDSLRLDGGENVRLIGVDTPESSNNRKLREDLYKMDIPVRERDMVALGERAAAFTAELCLGKRCWLEYEKDPRDQYGRTLAYVHLEDGRIVNEVVLAAGYGKAYLSYPFKYRQRYVLLHTQARLEQRGLWAGSDYSVSAER